MYKIKENYIHRTTECYFDDTTFKDEWQDEVYAFAKKIAVENGINDILDIGTGSGYKLIKYFKENNTLGIDVPQTVSWLNAIYPDKQWTDKFEPVTGYSLVIASDVIEHLINPDDLLDLIIKCQPKFVVLSTPNRDLMYDKNHNGPPNNLHHIREWNEAEFHDYISTKLNVIAQFTSNATQCTQTVLASVK